MAPRQVFPYDEGGGGLRPSSRHLLVDPSSSKWADARASVRGNNGPPFAPPVSTQEVCRPPPQQHSSDLHDALNDDDDDDDDDDGEGSVDLGSTWASSRDFAPKRGVEIFVGGLTRSTRRDMLRDWFQHAGEVTEVRIARDKRRRRCRGYGYVRFATSEQANRAIDTMHRFEFKHGRFLGVLPSDENRTLFVGGLREEWSCEYLSQLLKEKMPGLRKIEPIPDREDRFKIRTFCFLEFASHAEAAVIFNRHHTTPRPTPPSAQQTTNSPPSPCPPGLASLELLLPSSACGAGGGEAKKAAAAAGGGGDGSGVFFERDTRDRSTSTCTTSCASNGGGECCRIGACDDIDGGGLGSSAMATTGPTSASPDLHGSGALRFNGSGLWGRQHLGIDDNNHGDGAGNGFCCWDEETAATAVDGGGDIGAAGDGDESGDGEEAGAWTGDAVPLVVAGATLKVDWADPLRYHIHLNGGIKGPSASPEFGMPPDGRPSSRGGDVGFPGGRMSQAGGAPTGNVRAVGGRFGVGSHWQQQRRRPAQEQQQGLVRHPSSLLSDPRWHDGGDHSARMAQGGLREQQQRCLDVSRDRRPSHLPQHNGGGGGGGVLRVPTRERGYTIAAGYAASRRSRFDADVHDGGRSAASQEQQQHQPGYGDRPRSKSSSQFHASLAAAVAAASSSLSPDQQDYVDARMAIPSAHHRDHHHRQQARLQPHPPLAASGGGSVGSQDLLHRAGSDIAGSVPGGVPRGAMHHLHPRVGGGAIRGVPTGRPYSASPDISAGRHGRREAFSVGYGGGDGNGDGGGDGNGNMPLSRSASCRPFGEQQQQQHSAGAGGDRRASAALLSPSWEHQGSVEDNTGVLRGYSSLGALDWPVSQLEDLTASAGPLSRGLGQRHMSAVSLHGDQLSGMTSGYDGHRSQRQQQQQRQQRWEQPGVRDRSTDTPVMMKDHAPPPLDGGGGGGSHHYSANFATFDRRLDQQQQQQQRFSTTVPAAPQPHTRRHTVSGGLDLGLGMISSSSSSGGGLDNSSGGSNPPPGFPAGSVSAAVDAWGAPPALVARPGSTAAAAAAEDGPAAGMHLGARLWERMGGLDCQERSWPSALLSPDETGGGEQPWGS